MSDAASAPCAGSGPDAGSGSGAASESGVTSGQLDALRRWEDMGAVWRVLTRTASAATVSLCRCDGGEEVERLRITDPAALAHLGGRAGSDETEV